MDRHKNNSVIKDPSGMTSTDTTKTVLRYNTRQQCRDNLKVSPTPLETFHKKDSCLTKTASPSVTSSNSGKQQPTNSEKELVKTKQDQVQLGLPSKRDPKRLSVSSPSLSTIERKPGYSDVNTSKSKQDGSRIYKKTAPTSTTASASATSHDNGKQQPINSEKELVKTKQDQVQLGLPSKRDPKRLSVSSPCLNTIERKPGYSDVNISKSKQDGSRIYKKTAPTSLPVSASATNQNNGKQRPINSEKELVKAKQNQIQMGLPSKRDPQRLSVSSPSLNNIEQKSGYNDANTSKSKQDGSRVYKKTAPNSMTASASATSHNNGKQQPINCEKQFVIAKQDQIQLGLPFKRGPKRLSVSSPSLNNIERNPSYSDVNTSKSKQVGSRVSKKTAPNSMTASPSVTSHNNGKQQSNNNENKIVKMKQDPFQLGLPSKENQNQTSTSALKSRDDRNHVSNEWATSSNHTQAVNTSSVGTIQRCLWQVPEKGRVAANPVKFRTGPSELDAKLKNETAETTGTKLFMLNKSFQRAKLILKSCEEIKEETLQSYLSIEPALSALHFDIPAGQIKEAIRKKLNQTGTAFASTQELIEAVFKLETENQEPQKETFKNQAAPTSTSTKFNFAGSEEGKFLDRKTLEENEMLKQEKTCKICLDAQIGIVFIPCGHLVSCVKCSENMKTCPLCRAAIQSTIKTFFS